MLDKSSVVFLLDVDNTLLDNDRVVRDLHEYTTEQFGEEGMREYWAVFDAMRAELGYVDYLGSLQRYRIKNPHDHRCLRISSFLLEYPFKDRLYPGALDVIKQFQGWGPTVILTDGDVVLQPWKIHQAHLSIALKRNVLIYIHKELELANVEELYPADHYVMVDDKLKILTAMKKIWGARLTTVFPKQGHYAMDPGVLASNPPADLAVEHIGELVGVGLEELVAAGKRS